MDVLYSVVLHCDKVKGCVSCLIPLHFSIFGLDTFSLAYFEGVGTEVHVVLKDYKFLYVIPSKMYTNVGIYDTYNGTGIVAFSSSDVENYLFFHSIRLFDFYFMSSPSTCHIYTPYNIRRRNADFSKTTTPTTARLNKFHFWRKKFNHNNMKYLLFFNSNNLYTKEKVCAENSIYSSWKYTI